MNQLLVREENVFRKRPENLEGIERESVHNWEDDKSGKIREMLCLPEGLLAKD
jgi:hypothetical protein